jgi:hypothetical protein
LILKLNVIHINHKWSKYDNFRIFIMTQNFQGLPFLFVVLWFLRPLSKCRHVLIPNPHTRNSGGFLLNMYLKTKRKLLHECFECQILRIISHPLSILLTIKAYLFGLAFELATSFIHTYDNSFAIFLGHLLLSFRFLERSFTNHHTRFRFHHAIRCYTHQSRRRANHFAFMLTSEFLKRVYHDMRISSILDWSLILESNKPSCFNLAISLCIETASAISVYVTCSGIRYYSPNLPGIPTYLKQP